MRRRTNDSKLTEWEPLIRGVSNLVFRSGAVAMGYSRKGNYPRWYPEALIAHIVVRRYRKRSSWWFLIFHTIIRPRAVHVPAWVPELKTLSKADMFKTQALYSALKNEISEISALAAIGEILRALQARRIAGARKTSARKKKPQKTTKR